MISVDDVQDRANLDAADQARLDSIHREAFGPEERQYSMAYMLGQAGQPDCVLRIVRSDRELVGYLYLELAPEAATAWLWYFAIDRSHRSAGAGALAVRDTLAMLRREHPDLRYVLFEVHRPGDGGEATTAGMDRRRIEFYRRLGACWVRGADYLIPAADDPNASLAYDPMFFALRGTWDRAEIGERILLMARDNFEGHPDDPRWQALQGSIPAITVIEPGGTAQS